MMQSTNHLPRSAAIRRGGFRAMLSIALVWAALALVGGQPPVRAAENAGGLNVVVPNDNPTEVDEPLNEGGSATEFSLLPPASAACSGDTVADGYVIHSFMVPAGVDLNALTFDATGPLPQLTGADFRFPLVSKGSGFIARPTAPDSGFLISFPPFSLSVFNSDVLPEGEYQLGYMCTEEGGTTLDRYWVTTMDITHDAGDSPGGFTWTAEQTAGTATTTTTTEPGDSTTTTTTGGSTTTTTAGGSTTSTTVDGSTTTTVDGSTTTTTAIAGPTTTVGSGFTGSGGSG